MTQLAPHMPLDARYASLSDREPEELLLNNMPTWLSGPRATPEIIHALNVAMGLSRDFHAQVGQQFSQLQSVETYCARLLEAELSNQFGHALHIHNDYLIVAHEQLFEEDSLLFTLRYKITYEEPKTLLWAALQNFAFDETLNKNSHFRQWTHHATYTGVEPSKFVQMCRKLDLGSRYQTYLQDFLKVAVPGSAAPNAEQSATHSALELLKTYDLEVDAHVAFLRNNISESAYRALISLVASTIGTGPAIQIMLDGKPMVKSSLSILDTAVDGVVVFSADSLLLHPSNRVIVYIPNDPVSPLHEYSSLQAFIDGLKARLSQSAYQAFFSRYIALSAQPLFLQSLKSMPPALGLTAEPLGMTVSHYLVSTHLKKMFADAQVLAVPTHVVDERERERKWQLYKSAGLFLVNVASLFVPQLGALMLAVAVGELLKEVYEGVEDWAHGDIDHARSHLLGVAKEVAVAAATVAGVAVVKKAVGSLSQAATAFVNKFEPITLDDGTERLWNRGLEHYAYTGPIARHEVVDEHGFFTVNGKKHIVVDDKKYGVEFDRNIKQWRIPHPKRQSAFKPALLHNREGAWQHAHERPLEWQGSTLLARLGSSTAELGTPTLDRIMQLTNTSHDVLREMHLENLPAPALLKVTVKRFEIDRRINTFIDYMARGKHTSAHFSDLQLSVLPLLPGWPVGKGLSLLDASGAVSARFGNPKWVQTINSLEVLPSAAAKGELLETVLQTLSEQERQALISPHVAVTPEAVQALAEQLATYAKAHRTQIFECVYDRFNEPGNTAAKLIQTFFPGLPGVVAEELAASASAADSHSLGLNKVPLGIAERARSALQDARLNRAFDGFFLPSSNAQDTEKLIRNYLPRLSGWPMASAFEVREGSISAKVISSFGAVGQAPARVMVRSAQGYRSYSQQEGIYILESGNKVSTLSTAIFHLLTESERSALGFSVSGDASQFNAALAKLAIEARAESSRALGIQPIKPLFKPPVRVRGTQWGYPLCGFDGDTYSSSLRRRVRDLYRGFDNDRVEQYLDSLVERGLDPLTVLRQEKRDKRELCACLQSWIERAPSPSRPEQLYMEQSEREYEACMLIVRAWYKNPNRMPWISSATSSSLSLDGLRLTELPSLPDSVSFSHIQNLNLNNMSFSRGINEFLAHFENVVTLELDNNRLTDLPTQLQHLPNLISLSMVRNHIALSESNKAILRSLTKLEVLNVSYNPLGREVDFNDMPYIRRVFLRNTGIREWPHGLITRPFLEIADLRENQITEIPDEVYRIPASILQNTSLTGNPLSASSRLRLARFVMQGGRSMGVRSGALLSETAAFEFWTRGITNSELARRSRLWSDLRASPASGDFFDVLNRLASTADAHRIRPDLTRRVWEMIEAANESASVRLDLLDVAAMPRSCTDSVAMAFSALEQQMQLSRIALDSSTQEAALLVFAKRLFRLDQLGRIASEDYSARLGLAGPAPDELEIHLAYRIGLAQELDLPDQPQHMMFNLVAGVTQNDLDRACAQIRLLEQTSALVEFVSTRDFWKEYLISLNASEVSVLTEPYFHQLSQLLRQSPDMSSERYLRRVGEIRDEQERVVAAWCLRKTQTVLPIPRHSLASSTGS